MAIEEPKFALASKDGALALRDYATTGEAKVAAAKTKLLALVAAQGLVANGPSTFARCNPPWTPWFLRRNAVMLPVAGAR